MQKTDGWHGNGWSERPSITIHTKRHLAKVSEAPSTIRWGLFLYRYGAKVTNFFVATDAKPPLLPSPSPKKAATAPEKVAAEGALEAASIDMVCRAKIKLLQADSRRRSSRPSLGSPSVSPKKSPKKRSSSTKPSPSSVAAASITPSSPLLLRASREREAAESREKGAAAKEQQRSPSVPAVCSRELPAEVCRLAQAIFDAKGRQLLKGDRTHLSKRTPVKGVGGEVPQFELDEYDWGEGGKPGKGEIVGEGAYASVTVVRHKRSGQRRCMKCVKTLDTQATPQPRPHL